MPNNLAIPANVIQSYQLPPHLRRRGNVENQIGNSQITQIKNQIPFDEYEGMIGTALLESLVSEVQIKNDLKFSIDPYEMGADDLHLTEWHKLRFTIENLKGDHTFIRTPSKDAYFQANVSGRYQINCNIWMYFLQKGDYNEERNAMDYANIVLLPNFAAGDYRLSINNTDGTLKELISVFPCRVGLYDVVSTLTTWYYNTIIPLHGSTILFLEAGEKIDFRVNTLGHVGVVIQDIKYEGNASMTFLDNSINSI